MATLLNHGLIGFTRKRIGLRSPTGPYGRNGRPVFCSIHHGGPVGKPRMTFSAARATVRDWQSYHQGKGWSDIGYHVLVDGLGRLYQGRPVSAVPAAVEGHNTGSVAVCFMQDGRSYGLNAAQRRTLKVLFEKGVVPWGIPPLRRMVADPSSAAGVWGHNEFPGHTSNACPGGHIMRHLSWRRARY